MQYDCLTLKEKADLLKQSPTDYVYHDAELAEIYAIKNRPSVRNIQNLPQFEWRYRLISELGSGYEGFVYVADDMKNCRDGSLDGKKVAPKLTFERRILHGLHDRYEKVSEN